MNQLIEEIKNVVNNRIKDYAALVATKYNVPQDELVELWQEISNEKPQKKKSSKAKPSKKPEKKVIQNPVPKAANNQEDFSKWKIKDLKAKCKELKIKGFSTKKKAELIEILNTHAKDDEAGDDKADDKPEPEEDLVDVLDDIEEDEENIVEEY